MRIYVTAEQPGQIVAIDVPETVQPGTAITVHVARIGKDGYPVLVDDGRIARVTVTARYDETGQSAPSWRFPEVQS